MAADLATAALALPHGTHIASILLYVATKGDGMYVSVTRHLLFQHDKVRFEGVCFGEAHE